MANKIYANYPPPLSSEQETLLIQTVKDWTIEHGLAVRPSTAIVPEETNREKVLATTAPVTLFPSPFPKSCFDQARSLQQTYNELYAAIANDEDWLETIMKELIQVDDFIAKLWETHLRVKQDGYIQNITLGMFRSDYMLHTAKDSPPSLKQVEFNTISSSFGGLSCLVAEMHTHLATYPSPQHPVAYPPHPLFNNHEDPSVQSIGHPPPNTAVSTLTAGLAAAHQAYGPSKSSPQLPTCILFLVQDGERNIFDQLALSRHLHKHHGIPSFRLPTSKVMSYTHSDFEHPSRPLLYTPPSSPSTKYEVTVVYFRALYAPTEYDNAQSWEARYLLERSGAIKCPSVLLHLAGSKKVQQVLTSRPPGPNHLKTFLPNHSDAALESLRSTFAPQYSLSSTDPAVKAEGIKLALDPTTAANHVLKPQREGGGNNIYRTNIPPFLKSIPESEWKQYILMELIHPPEEAHNTALRRDGAVYTSDVISELGIFGTCLWKNSPGVKQPEVMHNTEGGYLMRTKAKDSDEGGVAAGFSSLDSLILYEEA
ncbi:Glutathione synthetase [Exophiala xenobiotica]|uniref:Glutathione synthetase n=1 Tax=Vermiconidia calcicola TaxID=1690605 RepID=A0AAV9QJ13_9PEZI|nr:Glutathione synthetase [Exophiala xenobiotica]KAK5434337.1 Glutathione synthetase [Exophiala xenobiotica]KAK5539211.1 Glutathione synthetase [Chaetothyriales sp. CCFEE 6169]KAK5542569.1 Glutathione synthetase [Vermiconidia calcicola]